MRNNLILKILQIKQIPKILMKLNPTKNKNIKKDMFNSINEIIKALDNNITLSFIYVSIYIMNE